VALGLPRDDDGQRARPTAKVGSATRVTRREVSSSTHPARPPTAKAGEDGGFVLILPKTRREGQPAGRATHVRFANDGAMAESMTLCTQDGSKVTTASYNTMIGVWLDGNLPQTFAIEDKRRALPNGSFWVTGGTCRAPE